MHKLYKLKDMLCDELKEYGNREKLDVNSLEAVDKLAHATKNLMKVIEECENEMNNSNYNSYGYSMGMTPMRYDGSFARGGRGQGMNRNGGRSMANGDFRTELQEMMNNAPNDYTRQKLMEIMNEM